jgi:hypothetical protein
LLHPLINAPESTRVTIVDFFIFLEPLIAAQGSSYHTQRGFQLEKARLFVMHFGTEAQEQASRAARQASQRTCQLIELGLFQEGNF